MFVSLVGAVSEQHDVWLKQLNVMLATSDRSAAIRGRLSALIGPWTFFTKCLAALIASVRPRTSTVSEQERN